MKAIKKEIVVRYMEEVEKETLWELKEEIIIKTSKGLYVTIPVGFQTDFASVPKIFWSIISSIGKYNLASVIHDYFYTTHLLDRKSADEEFLRWMTFIDPKRQIRNKLMYYMVRLFGAYRYRTFGNG